MTLRHRLRTLLVACAIGAALVPAVGGRAAPGDAPACPTGVFCVGAASVDMTWHTGAGQGQYGSEGNSLTSGKFDPFHHQTKMVPTDGIASRTFAKAIVVRGADGTKVAYAKTELYLQQDILTRRVGQLISGADPTIKDYVVDGLSAERVMLGGTHNHSVPMYASTSFGVWAFTDTFDFRMFETTARRIAQSIKDADEGLTAARVGASVTRFDRVQQNILGPATADDGSPAGFPRDYFDDELAVIRFDTADGSRPIAAWVNLGMHPESMSTIDLISSDFVGVVERIVERRLGRAPGAAEGPVVSWSQGAVGDIEPDQSRANPVSKKREYWHRDVAQSERMSRIVSDAVLDTWDDVARGTPDVPAKYVEPTSTAPVAMIDKRFAGPIAHPLPTVSNCRTEHPGVPVAGVPDCVRPGQAPEQYGATVDLLRASGIPLPSNYGAPSHGGVQESTTIHLQAIRIGDILVTTCPCEPITDMVRNLKTRTDIEADNMHVGFEWPCTGAGGKVTCDFRRASHEQSQVREVDRSAWERMRAQIGNDARGWEDDVETLQGESEPTDPDEIFGNFTHEEVQDLRCGTAPCGGYRLPLMVGHANDYLGYVVTYREYMRGDHYRKALTAFGAHSADYINTRLVRMAVELAGGPAVMDAVTTPPTSSIDDLIQRAKTHVIGGASSQGLAAYSSAIPDDGGTPGKVIEQPASLERFGAATFTWEGGSNWTDNPVVRVERQQPDGAWSPVATQEGGEIVLTLAYEEPSPTAALDWLTGGKVYRWTATYEVFEETEPGTYRFVADGHHREGRKPNPYTVTSEPFDVSVWRGIRVHDLVVDTAKRTASFDVSGVELTEPADKLETDEDGTISPREVHYPESYESDLAYIERTYASPGGTTHRYCFRCTFRPWADTGEIERAQITVREAHGRVRRYAASLEGERWVARGLDLARGDVLLVEAGGVRDRFGNVNGTPSDAVGPFTDLDPRAVPTALEYTGARSGRVGKYVVVSAVLKTADGEPLEGMTIAFKRGKRSVSATTDGTGRASARLRVDPPTGRSRPIVVSFAGSDPYQATQISAPFNARR